MTADTSEANEFETLLVEQLDSAYRTARYLTGNRDDAEELVQEASLLAQRGFAKFQRGTNFKAWFLTILRNRFISDYRRKKRRIETVDVEDPEEFYLLRKTQESGIHGESEDPARFLFDKLDTPKVAEAFDRLPEEFREVCVMYFTQDLSYLEIANVLSIPVGTVRSRIHRGRKLLQHSLWDVAADYGLVKATAGEQE